MCSQTIAQPFVFAGARSKKDGSCRCSMQALCLHCRALRALQTRKAREIHPMLQQRHLPVVLDLGSSTLRAGFANPEAGPQVVMPSSASEQPLDPSHSSPPEPFPSAACASPSSHPSLVRNELASSDALQAALTSALSNHLGLSRSALSFLLNVPAAAKQELTSWPAGRPFSLAQIRRSNCASLRTHGHSSRCSRTLRLHPLRACQRPRPLCR